MNSYEKAAVQEGKVLPGGGGRGGWWSHSHYFQASNNQAATTKQAWQLGLGNIVRARAELASWPQFDGHFQEEEAQVDGGKEARKAKAKVWPKSTPEQEPGAKRADQQRSLDGRRRRPSQGGGDGGGEEDPPGDEEGEEGGAVGAMNPYEKAAAQQRKAATRRRWKKRVMQNAARSGGRS